MKTFKIFDTEKKEIAELNDKQVKVLMKSPDHQLDAVKDSKKKITGYTLAVGALSYPVVNEDGSLSDNKIDAVAALADESAYEPYFSEDKFIGYKLKAAVPSTGTEPQKPEETKPGKKQKAVNYKHSFRFSINKFVTVVTNSTDKAAAFAEALRQLVDNRVEAERHSRYDGCKVVE